MGLRAFGLAVALSLWSSGCSSGHTDGAGGAGNASAHSGSPTSGSAGPDAASSGSSGSTGSGQGGAGAGLRYDEVYQKATHNSYERDEALFDQLVYHRVRALELDIHIGKTLWPDVPGNWYVYHADIPTQNATLCHRFSDCLDALVAFDVAVPDHEVTTVFIDLKDDFDAAGHGPADLDALLLAKLGPKVFTPADLLAKCGGTSLRAAVTGACGWPTLAELKGRWIFALTGGTACAPGGRLHSYGAGGGKAAFMAAGVDGTCPVSSYASEPDVVFLNMAFSDVASATPAHAAGLVSRVYYGGLGGGLDDQPSWDAAVAAQAHFLATDKVNFEYDTWSTTHNARGYPFHCFGNCPDTLVEGSAPIGTRVSSGDLWGSSDNGAFFSANDAAANVAFEAAISTRNSHVEPWGKGCLMARADASPSSPYFAVCRPSDSHVVRVQSRTSAGGNTSATEVDLVPSDTVDQDAVTFARLEISGSASAPTLKGYGSLDGKSWKLIASSSFSVALPQRGVFASAHGSPEPLRFLFHALVRDENGMKSPLGLADLAQKSLLGDASVGDVYLGPLP